jgi:hypothetical protein
MRRLFIYRLIPLASCSSGTAEQTHTMAVSTAPFPSMNWRQILKDSPMRIHLSLPYQKPQQLASIALGLSLRLSLSRSPSLSCAGTRDLSCYPSCYILLPLLLCFAI